MADASALREEIRRRAQAAGDDASEQMRLALVGAAPVGQTGETARTITAEPVASGGDVLSWKVTAPTPQAKWTNDGTPAHVIRPVRAKRLRFLSPGTGVVFASEVNHPGTKATHWFDLTVTEESWGAALNRAFNRLG